jgi:pimeloyl-ACP methyl ester carboxylesterase
MAVTGEVVVEAWNHRVQTSVLETKNGPDLVWLHGEAGLQWSPFLDRLGDSFALRVPYHPGTSPGDFGSIRALDDVWDLSLYYEEVFDSLGLDRVHLAGHSFGAMVACEIAAAFPERVDKLVLISPVGLWRDDVPVLNWMEFDTDRLFAATYHGPSGEAAAAAMALLEAADPEAMAGFVWALACTGKFVWPLADKGLRKRIHRVEAPTLVVWGRHDGIVSAEYAKEFEKSIPNCRAVVLEDSAHVPHLEQTDEVLALINAFIAP